MKAPITRRRFVKRAATATALAAAFGAPAILRSQSPSERIVIGVMGLGRGLDHVRSSLTLKNLEVGYVCDVDDSRLARGVKTTSEKQEKTPKAVKDVRQVLEDKDIDALFIAAPNHWHAPATILACSAGKHVYVEKPASHNPWEAEMMVQAARKNNRKVQMGNQRRSWPAIIEAMEKLRSGAIGRVTSARGWYNNQRGSIGRGKPAPIPEGLDYRAWQGPAPERPYVDNLVHYNWHWRWHWGGGELANNGPHALDLIRWGLGVEYPQKVTCNGGRYHFDDDQQTPDTILATYDFGTSVGIWDSSSCHPRSNEKLPFVAFYGEGGSLVNFGTDYVIYDIKGKEVARQNGPGGEAIHIQNFLDAIRNGTKLNAEIEDGQKSVMLCHLGNIAYRTGRTIHFNPKDRRIKEDAEAELLWKRDYRPGWEPKV